MSEYPNISKSLWSLALPIADLNSDPANARLHPDRNLDAIKASLHKFGQRKCIVVQKKGMIVRAGNGTMAAAKSLGWTHLACNVIDEDSTDATSFAIADNRTAELAEWDDETLASLLQSLPQECQIAAGFDPDELNELLSSLTPEVVEDVTPEPPASPVSRLGDLWVCGEHRVLCGDSTSAEAVAAVLNGVRADIVVTDPPYGVNYVGKTSQKLEVHNDDPEGLAKLLDGALTHALKNTKPGAVWYVAAPPGPLHQVFGDWLLKNGVWRQTITWVKNSMVMGHSDYHYQHEVIFYGWTPGAKHKAPPDRTQTTIWNCDRPSASKVHPTMKPVELFSRAISNSAEINWVVYDPFLGSGTTLIAAEQLGRKCYGMEISPQYVDVIVTRWQTLTGKSATLESSGETFAETSKKRLSDDQVISKGSVNDEQRMIK